MASIGEASARFGKKVPAAAPVPSIPTPANSEPSEILEEVLELVRQQHRILNDPATLLPPRYLESLIVSSRDLIEGHPVFDDLADQWIALCEQVSRARDKDQPQTEAIFRAIERLGSPIEYILRRNGRNSASRKRRRALMTDSPDAD